MFYIVEAAHDENGKISYGRPGDQTGDEVRIRQASKNETFTYILRCPNASKTALFAKDALAIANNKNVGYAQFSNDGGRYSARYGLWYRMKELGNHADFSKISQPCNTDCSQMVSSVLTNNGYASGIYMSTSTEVGVLEKLGFKKIPYSLANLKNGDVLWRQGHTAFAVEKVESSSNSSTSNQENEKMFSAILKSSGTTKTWSTGAGPLTRALPYITVTRAQLGFKPSVICIQQQGEVLSLCQWMRDQKEGFLYVSNHENDASAGVAVGTAAGYFNPDLNTLYIPVRYPEVEYIVKIYP